MIDFSISQLKEFTTLAGTLNYSETAFRLNISPSALTRHIQNLENELNGLLFRRTTRSIELTEFGRTFLPHAVMILQDYETGINALESFRLEKSSFFHFGASYSMDEYDAKLYLKDYSDTYPEYHVILVTGSMAELERGFKMNQFNVYAGINDPEIDGLNFLRVGYCVVKAVVPSGSNLSECEKVRLADLKKIPLFLPVQESSYYRKIILNFKKIDITPRILYTGRFEESIDYIRNGNGIALFPFRMDREKHIDGLAFLDTDPQIIFEYGMVYREGLTEPEAALINHMRKLTSDNALQEKILSNARDSSV